MLQVAIIVVVMMMVIFMVMMACFLTMLYQNGSDAIEPHAPEETLQTIQRDGAIFSVPDWIKKT